jgi:hypothetical protein
MFILIVSRLENYIKLQNKYQLTFWTCVRKYIDQGKP